MILYFYKNDGPIEIFQHQRIKVQIIIFITVSNYQDSFSSEHIY